MFCDGVSVWTRAKVPPNFPCTYSRGNRLREAACVPYEMIDLRCLPPNCRHKPT